MSALITATIALSTAASAQDAPRSTLDVITDEIIVTATKKADGENQQDTNLAITAIGADQLEVFQVRNLGDLSFKIPNVQLDDIGTVKGIANFAIRGLGVNSSIPSIEPTVGVFVDGIYLGINTGVLFDNFDLDSVEVLRGPQGVLFGRNVTGGAVLLNTGNPTDDFSFKAKATVESGLNGNGENYFLQGVISGPIGDSGLKTKLGIYYNDDKGFFENLFDEDLFALGNAQGAGVIALTPAQQQDQINRNNLNSSNFGLSQTFIIRGALEYDGIEGLNVLAKLESGDTTGDGPAAQSSQNALGVNSFATNFAGLTTQTFDPNTLDFAVNNRGFQDSEWLHGSLRADLDVGFGNGTITNIFGYREFSQTASSDIDATIAQVFDILVGIEQDQISNELRYNGRFLDDKLDFTTGLFYFNQDIAYAEQRRVFGAQTPFDGGGVQNSETFGIFASGEYDVTDKLSVNAGIRYSDETKEANIALIQFLGGASCFVEGTEITGDMPCVLEEFPTFSTNNFSPKIGLGYEVQDNFRLYGHWQRAFRAGGFNLRNTALQPASELESPGPFNDERVDSFEIGFKSEPFGGVRFNGAGFYNTIDDIQREINVSGGSAVVQQVIANAGDVDVYGFEFDVLWPVTDNFLLNGSIGVTQSNFTEVNINLLAANSGEINNPPADGVLDLQLPRLAPFTASAGFTYAQDFGFGEVVFNGNYSHRDASFFTDNNFGIIPSQDRFDANVSYDVPNSGVNLTVYGKNITNEVILGGDTQLSNGTFSPLGKGGVYGVELTYEY